MLKEIEEVLLAEMEEQMQDEVDKALQIEVYHENWYGFTGEDSVSVLLWMHPETHSSVIQRYRDVEAQCLAPVQEHSPSVHFTSRTLQLHSKILNTPKFKHAKSEPHTDTSH